ncbi:MAG TPA: aspartate aminotransferase family protein [Gammaproteobacteria bacterium]|nr:aspartate aminotransferase family protein [Gammaproteobacteria bacterium]|tara:strand:- start:1405 stop:2571 length:1167 start_codon:yes stop_codon:yes gene_type:complete
MTEAIMPTYGRQDVAFIKGDGTWLEDNHGNRYLDALGGLAVIVLGHANKAVSRTLKEQSETLLHTSNLYRIPKQEQLAEALRRLSGMKNMFFGNSGAEANECAIKIARLYGHNKGIENPTIIVADSSFHGRTLATLTATGNRKVQAGFEPLVKGFIRVPYNDIGSVNAISEQKNSVVAIMVEPVQGEGGIQVPDNDYLQKLRQLCDANDWLLIIDEIQCAIGRTGTFFCYEQSGILPDVVTIAKGLANGVPIGACLASGEAAEVMQPGTHGSTFGGNPLSCATALTVLQEVEVNNLAERAAELGNRMMEQFRARLEGLNIVKEIRGKGLMIGIELDSPCGDLVARAFDKGLLINVTAEKVVRLLPHLTTTDEEADLIVDIVSELIETV